MSIEATSAAISNCINEIRSWMGNHFLKLNDEKTELLILSSKATRHTLSPPSLKIGDCTIEPSTKARNLGVIFDSTLSLEDHVNSICRKSHFILRNISLVRKYVTSEVAATLIQALVISKIDYCNSLLYGLPKQQIDKLQRIHNSAARVVARCNKYEHISPVLQNLHWLPVNERIEYKILVLVYKALHDLGPTYIQDLLQEYQPTRYLRSCAKHLLVVPKYRTKSFGDRCFAKAGPTLWNSIPISIRQSKDLNEFKRSIKTFLFKQAYNVL